jgi:hypothetical protein
MDFGKTWFWFLDGTISWSDYYYDSLPLGTRGLKTKKKNTNSFYINLFKEKHKKSYFKLFYFTLLNKYENIYFSYNMRTRKYIYIYTMWILRIVALSRIAVMVRAHFAQWDKTQYSHKTVVNTDEQRMFEDRPELRHGITPGPTTTWDIYPPLMAEWTAPLSPYWVILVGVDTHWSIYMKVHMKGSSHFLHIHQL